MSEEVAASCAGGYGKSKVYKKRPINDNEGSLASSLGTEREYLKTRTTLFSGRKVRHNFCINKLASSVGPSTKDYFLKNECNGKYNSSCDYRHKARHQSKRYGHHPRG
uniref:Uncharacterized protein n=1 Tax=Tanacetum cinerariifolium TaxID=118510 RepID=A0A699LA53_TANCI|nr:hypothetical protein [Tanacetum cinerariifolium]